MDVLNRPKCDVRKKKKREKERLEHLTVSEGRYGFAERLVVDF
jgi:hypothetical protein